MEAASELAGGEPGVAGPDEEAEHLEAGRMGEAGEEGHRRL